MGRVNSEAAALLVAGICRGKFWASPEETERWLKTETCLLYTSVQQQLGLPLPAFFSGIFPPAVDGKIPGDLSQEGGKPLGSAGWNQLPRGVIGVVDAFLSVQRVG